MKKLLVVLAAVAMSTGAFAQKHMVNFNAGEIVGAFDWTTGSNQNETRERALTLNYAYTLLPKLQLGGKAHYSYNSSEVSKEEYGVQVGAIYNLNKEIRSSYYASLYLGMDWTNYTEVHVGTAAIGKRIPLAFLNTENFVYSPEVEWESKTGANIDGYTQSLRLKFLNFSLFF